MADERLKLKEIYERMLHDSVDCALTTMELQPLPYFFSFLCHHGISPDKIDERVVSRFIEDRYLIGNVDTSILIYLRSIDLALSCLGHKSLTQICGDREKFCYATIDALEEKGVKRGSKSNPSYDYILTSTPPLETIRKIMNKSHPRG